MDDVSRANLSDFQLASIIEEYLEDYNQITVAKMQLVLFMDALKHVCRINRYGRIGCPMFLRRFSLGSLLDAINVF